MTKRNALRDDRAGASRTGARRRSAAPIRRTTRRRISTPAPTSWSSAKASRRSKSCCRPACIAAADSLGGGWSAIHGIVFKARGRLGGAHAAAAAAAGSRSPAVSRSRPRSTLPTYLDAWRERHGVGTVSLITARGCPYTCTWCSRSVFGETHRRRSVTNVADEVEAIVDRYHPERLWYADDVFAIHRGWTLDYARGAASAAGCACRSSASRAPSGSTTTWPMRCASWAACACGSVRKADRSASSTR